MADFYDQISDTIREWIEQQHTFFVGSAPLSGEGHINLSPKGGDCLRVLDENTVAYLDLTGSGNETSAHIMENGRITMMWCAYEGPPRILRLYGEGEIALSGSDRWDELIGLFTMIPGARQIVINHVSKVQTSCGFAVPHYEYQGERDALRKWTEHKGQDGLETFRCEHSTHSIDGLLTPFGETIETSQTPTP